jgi:hypothetical protein
MCAEFAHLLERPGTVLRIDVHRPDPLFRHDHLETGLAGVTDGGDHAVVRRQTDDKNSRHRQPGQEILKARGVERRSTLVAFEMIRGLTGIARS